MGKGMMNFARKLPIKREAQVLIINQVNNSTDKAEASREKVQNAHANLIEDKTMNTGKTDKS